jgi:hypothetical protein
LRPITVFIAPVAPLDENANHPLGSGGPDGSDVTGTTLRFGIRWFTIQIEVALCEHSTLAAATSVFREARGGAESDLKGPAAIHFEATWSKFLVARKVEEDCVEIVLDSDTVEALSAEGDAEVRGVLVKYTGCRARHLRMYTRCT